MLTLINQSLNWYYFCELEGDGHMVRGGGGDRMKSGCVVIAPPGQMGTAGEPRAPRCSSLLV